MKTIISTLQSELEKLNEGSPTQETIRKREELQRVLTCLSAGVPFEISFDNKTRKHMVTFPATAIDYDRQRCLTRS